MLIRPSLAELLSAVAEVALAVFDGAAAGEATVVAEQRWALPLGAAPSGQPYPPAIQVHVPLGEGMIEASVAADPSVAASFALGAPVMVGETAMVDEAVLDVFALELLCFFWCSSSPSEPFELPVCFAPCETVDEPVATAFRSVPALLELLCCFFDDEDDLPVSLAAWLPEIPPGKSDTVGLAVPACESADATAAGLPFPSELSLFVDDDDFVAAAARARSNELVAEPFTLLAGLFAA